MRLARSPMLIPTREVNETSGHKTSYVSLLLLGSFCMLLPFEELLVFNSEAEGVTVLRYLGLVVILWFGIIVLSAKEPFKVRSAQLWVVLFVGLECLSCVWSISPENSIRAVPTALSLLLFYLVVGAFKTDEKGFDVFIAMTIAGGVAAALYSIYSYHFVGMVYRKSGRASLFYGERSCDPNFLVFMLLLPFSYLLLKMSRARNMLRRLCCLAGLLSIGCAVLFTASRSGFLAIVAILSLHMLRKRVKEKRAAAVIMIIMAIIIVFYTHLILQRLTFQQDSFEHSRGEIWLANLSALPNYWLLGGGLESIAKIYMDASNQYNYGAGAHNIFIGTIMELGIVGLFILTVLLVQHYKALRINSQIPTNTIFAIKAAFMGMLLQGFFIDILTKKSFWLVLALIMMLSAGATGVSRQRR